MKVLLPISPISDNHIYKRGKGHGLYMTDECKGFKMTCGWYFKKALLEIENDWDLNCKYKVSIMYYINRDKDVSNMNKALLDAGQGILYNNDNQICILNLEKVKCRTNGIKFEIEYL